MIQIDRLWQDKAFVCTLTDEKKKGEWTEDVVQAEFLLGTSRHDGWSDRILWADMEQQEYEL